VKKGVFTATLLVMFAMGASAQDHSKAINPEATPPSRANADWAQSLEPGKTGGPPAACKPCLFYGGDINPTDPFVFGYPNGNSLTRPLNETLGAVQVPAGAKANVKGLLFNVLATKGEFNPQTATWEIRTGVSANTGGTVVASGSGAATITPTGRVALGFTEYTVSVPASATLTAGEYWINVTPQCTDTSDNNCAEGFFASNTTQQTNNVHGSAQPLRQMYFNSTYFGFTWTNWCDPSLGLNSSLCAALSFGISGTAN
jgi:hypothetical protein